MNINLITRHLDRNETLLTLARRRAGYAFSRFGSIVRSVDIRLSDENGPRGGQGISCLARVHLASGGHVLVESSAVTPEDGIAQAIARLENRLRRLISRQQDHH
jgi:putative sigma-54 modulation protein